MYGWYVGNHSYEGTQRDWTFDDWLSPQPLLVLIGPGLTEGPSEPSVEPKQLSNYPYSRYMILQPY